MNTPAGNEQPYVVFGGTFDPVHEGHVAGIALLKHYFPRIILAPTDQNPWKGRAPTPLATRIEMLACVLQTRKLGDSVQIDDFSYVFAKDFATYATKRYGSNICWAVGQSNVADVPKWKDWSDLMIPLFVLPETVPVHSTDIRSGKSPLLAELRPNVKRQGLYLSEIVSDS